MGHVERSIDGQYWWQGWTPDERNITLLVRHCAFGNLGLEGNWLEEAICFGAGH